MTTTALQEFLRSLSGPLGAIGVPPRSLDDLRAAALALEPFKDLDLAQLADFLRRAAAFRQSGEVPAVAVPGLDSVISASRQLNETVQAMQGADTAAIGEVEGRVQECRRDLQIGLRAMAESFGITAKLADDKKWLPGLRAKHKVTRTVEAFRRLASQITDRESYQTEAVLSAIERLAAEDAKIIKAAVAEMGAAGTGTGKKLVESVLTKLTGIDSKPPKPAKKPRREEPAASDEQVEGMVQTLEEMVARAKDPNAVPDSEIDAILARVGSEFSADQQKAIAKRVTGQGGRSASGAIANLRMDLTAVKRLVESQRV